MSDVISKLGFHNLGSNHTGTGECFATINAAGRQIACIDGHDDYGLNSEAFGIWPGLLSIGDLTEFEANFDIDLLRKHAALNPWITHWQVYNEINGDWVGQADRLINIMQTYGNEFKFVIWNCADGTPQYPEIDPVPYAQVARACTVAKAGGHLLGLHEYGNDWSGDHLLRYRRLMSYLAAHDALCDIVITEAGPVEAGTFDKPSFLAWCQRYDAELMKDAAVKAAAVWTLGGGWYDYHTALPELGNYIATVQPVTPPPVEEREFDHWLHEETGVIVSYENPFDLKVLGAGSYKAITRPKAPPPQVVTIAVSTDGYGSVTGGGQYTIGSTARLGWIP